MIVVLTAGAVMLLTPVLLRICVAPPSANEMGSWRVVAMLLGTPYVPGGCRDRREGWGQEVTILPATGDAAASVGQMAQAFAGQHAGRWWSSVERGRPTLADHRRSDRQRPTRSPSLGDTRQCISSLKALKTAAPDVPKYLIASCLDKTVTDNVGQDARRGAKAFTTVITTGDRPDGGQVPLDPRGSTRLTSTRTAWRTWATR